MTDFIDANIVLDPTTLTDTAVDAYAGILQNNGFPGYVPSDGDGEIILLSVVMQMFADAKGMAAVMPSAAFRQFGTQLLGIPYAPGSAAAIGTTWTLADTLGHTIPGGIYVTVSSLGFYVLADVVIPPGQSTAIVPLVAVESGTSYNNATDPVEPVDQIDWVLGVKAIGVSTGGADAETDGDFQNGLTGELQLQAPRPITSTDFAGFVLTPSAVNATGVTVGRSTSIDGYDPGVSVFTGTVANTSATVTAVSTFSGVTAGSVLSGANIPIGTTVQSINPSGSSFVMTAPATGSATETITATGSYGNQREESVFVTDSNGQPFAGASTTTTSGPACLALQAWLQSFREANFIVQVLSPTYTPVYVTAAIHVLAGYDVPTTLGNAQAAVLNLLNPATWGNPGIVGSAVANQWLNATQGYNVVRYNDLVAAIRNVPGVQYVPPGSGGLAVGLSATPTGTVDLALPGPAPLPLSTAATVLISAV